MLRSFHGIGNVAPVVIESVDLELVENAHHARQHIRSPTRAGRRAAHQIPVATEEPISGSRPLLPVIRVGPDEVTAGRIRQDLHSPLVDHGYEAVEPRRVQRRQLVAAAQPQLVVPIVHDLYQLNAVVLQPVQFALVVLVGIPWLAAGVFPEIVDALGRQVVGDQVPAQAGANGLLAKRDVLQPPSVILGRIGINPCGKPGTPCESEFEATAEPELADSAPARAAWADIETAAPVAAAWTPLFRKSRRRMAKPPRTRSVTGEYCIARNRPVVLSALP